MIDIMQQEITFSYKNWKGVESIRRAIVEKVYWGSTKYHPEKQWIAVGFDLDKQAYREFALLDMKDVTIKGTAS